MLIVKKKQGDHKYVVTLFDSSYEDSKVIRGSRGRDIMVVGFTTTCAIIAYHP